MGNMVPRTISTPRISLYRTAGIVLISILIGIGLLTSAQAKSKKPVKLTLASLFPPESPSAKSLNRWIDKVEKDSNGTLLIRHYPANTLIPAPEMRSSVKVGVADLGCSFIYKPEPGFEPSLFLSQLIRGLNYQSCLNILDDILTQFPDLWADQWKDFELIWLTTIDPNLIITLDKPVHTLSDLKGQQLRIPNPKAADILKRLGATPVSMPPADWIVSIDKGMTDGATTSLGSLLDYKIGAKIKYVTRYSTGPGMVFLTMNKRSYNRLSPEHKAIIDNAKQFGKQDMINTKKTELQHATDYLKENGVQYIDLPEQEMALWDETTLPVLKEIGDELNKKGFPGTKLVDFAIDRAEFYKNKNVAMTNPKTTE